MSVILISRNRLEPMEVQTRAFDGIASDPHERLVGGEKNDLGLLGEFSEYFESCRAFPVDHKRTLAKVGG